MDDKCKDCTYMRERVDEKGPEYTCLFKLFRKNEGKECEKDDVYRENKEDD